VTSPLRVAVVARGAVLVEALRRPLAEAGHDVVTARSLDELAGALAAGAGAGGATSPASPPRAILVARRLGDEDGLAALARLDLPPLEPLVNGAARVLVSPDEEDRPRARDAGAELLHVPFDAGQLLAIVGAATRARKVILLVDDSHLIHRHTVPILTEAGYDVVSAFDGAEALSIAAARRPDLVVTDVEMPRLDGYALCKQLKERHAQLPVIICSALGEAADLERGFDAGADDYLVKPAQPEELQSRIRDLLLTSGLERGLRERILVADDSPAVRHLVADALTRQGFTVVTAADGLEALDRARESRIDLLVTDYDMPRMTGFELVHALRRDPQLAAIPTMMLTARNTRRDQAQMRAAGLTSYLVKPFSVDKCVAMVERLLAERRLRAYKEASRFYISAGAVRAAEQAADAQDPSLVRADEREVAILFSDICGFTKMSSEMEPRAIVDLLNEVFDVLCPAIVEEGGDIDKFIGDAIMAVFEERPGAPSAALRAVRAAIAMQEGLAAYRAAAPPGRPKVEIRIGVNLGRVVRGDIGSRHVRRDFTVIGDVVNRAQRFESNAPPNGILVGDRTYEATCDFIEYEPRPGLRLKNIADPVNAYLVCRAKQP
jgi:DNA-binding response OmpR family regulator